VHAARSCGVDAHPGTALIRRPGPALADGIVTHIDRVPVDVDLAARQWDAYARAMADHGWDLVEVPSADDCPDAVFVEDTVVMYRDVAILTRPGADTRKPEVDGVAKVVESLGYHAVRIQAPGTLDGGDVLKVGSTVYVGRGSRTNDEGIRQLSHALEPLGATVVAVPVTKVLHLKSAVTALPDGTVIGYPPIVDDPQAYDRFLAVPEASGSHVVLLGGGKLLMAADAPRSAELFADLGYDPVVVDIGEFEKLEGCVTCLSVRLRDRAPGS
jgi:dimethylargininase